MKPKGKRTGEVMIVREMERRVKALNMASMRRESAERA